MNSILLLIVLFAVGFFFLKDNKQKSLRKYLNNIFSDKDNVRHDGRRNDNQNSETNADGARVGRRMDALEEESRKLLGRIVQMEKTLSHTTFTLQVLSQKYNELVAQNSVERDVRDKSTSHVDESDRTNRNNAPSDNIGQEIGSIRYVTSPSAINPIRFAAEDLSLQPSGYFFYIRIIETGKAEFGVNNDRDAVQGFMSSLAYYQDCVEVLSKQEGTQTRIEVVGAGELEQSGKYWILTKKIQIKIK